MAQAASTLRTRNAPPLTASTWILPMANSWSSLAHPAAASPPACACWQVLSPPTAAPSASVVRTSPGSAHRTATWPWSFRTMPSTPICPWRRICPSRWKTARSRRTRLNPACTRPRRSCRWKTCWTASRLTFPVASASAWPWAAPSSANRPYSVWTSRYPTWMPSCAFPPARRSPTCSAALVPPPSMSPTTRLRQ